MNGFKILHVSDKYPGLHPTVGGAEIIAKRLVDLFHDTGWQQGLFTTGSLPPDNKATDLELFSSRTFEDLLPGESWITALKGELMPWDPIASGNFARTLKYFNPHVVLLHNIREISLGIVEICSQAECPVFQIVYDYTPFCPTGFFVDYNGDLCRNPGEKCIPCHEKQASGLSAWSEKLMPIRKHFFSPLLDHINAFIVLSEGSKELLSSIGLDKKKIKVIKQPLLHKPHRSNGDPNRILFVGWGQARKGLLVIAKALKEIQRPFSFIAVGKCVDKTYIQEVENELRAAALDPADCLKGRISKEQLDYEMNEAGIIVIAEQWENMSPVILHESMAAGKVVVAGEVGGISDFILDGVTGLLASFNDPSSFARRINEVLGDREKQREIGVRAIEAAMHNADPSETLKRFKILFSQSKGVQTNKRLKAWLSGIPCVIICGGNGSRMGNITNNLPKSLIPINGKPVIEHIINFWAPFVSQFILITNRKAAELKKYIEKLPYNIKLLIEKDGGSGITNALIEAKSLLKERFLMVLGDCLYSGPIRIPKGMDRGVGVLSDAPSELIRENFSVEITDGRISNLVEKPEKSPNNLCGMGVYFLDSAIWDAIETTRAEPNSPLHITSVLQTLAEKYELNSVHFEGEYVNINYPEDIIQAQSILKKRDHKGDDTNNDS